MKTEGPHRKLMKEPFTLNPARERRLQTHCEGPDEIQNYKCRAVNTVVVNSKVMDTVDVNDSLTSARFYVL